MRILGIDPGLEITGYGCISIHDGGINFNEAGVIRTKKSDDLPVRLTELYDGFTDILKEFEPGVVVIEDLYTHYNFPKTAIIMGHARGTLILAAGQKSIQVVSYSATRIKKSLTGNGHASKEQMQRMIMSLLGMAEPPSPPDIADALGTALCHANVVNRISF